MNYLPEVVQNSYGQRIRLDTGIDISGMTTVSIAVRKPDDSTTTWTGTKETADSDHGETEGTTIVQHVLQSADVQDLGNYKLRAKINDGSYDYYGDPIYLPVEEQ